MQAPKQVHHPGLRLSGVGKYGQFSFALLSARQLNLEPRVLLASGIDQKVSIIGFSGLF
jgi:hypothetical protein